MKFCKKLLLCSIALVMGISITACDSNSQADQDIFTNKFEILLERSDNIDAEYSVLDQTSNELLDQYKDLDSEYLALKAENKLDTEEASNILAKKKEINLQLKEIIAKIKTLKSEQESIRLQMEEFQN